MRSCTAVADPVIHGRIDRAPKGHSLQGGQVGPGHRAVPLSRKMVIAFRKG